jgi:Family of unknown function (DUF5819)
MKWLRYTIMALTSVWFVFHFFCTAVYNMPTNPLQTRFYPVYIDYMNSFFPQVWTLFAPNPIQSNSSLLLQCLKPGQKPSDNAWVDVIRPLWLQHEQHRFSAYDRLSRTFSNPMRDYIQGPYEAKGDMDLCQTGDKKACGRFENNAKKRRKIALKSIMRPVSAYCTDVAKSQGREPYQRVAVRIRTSTPPAWAQRFTGKTITSDTELGIQKTLKVQPIGLFRAPDIATLNTPLTATSNPVELGGTR